PNPFNPSTMIWYITEEPAHVSLEIYNLAGRRVALLLDGIEVPAGYHEVAWDGRDEMGRDVPTGTYIYRLRAGEYRDSGRMTLIK
ncbi:MAG: FlgD immunoglobulin-like domain containing protein, partial [bacterium]|nr:FlgD immunoglobulin-like domain containing protein [bacterium]